MSFGGRVRHSDCVGRGEHDGKMAALEADLNTTRAALGRATEALELMPYDPQCGSDSDNPAAHNNGCPKGIARAALSSLPGAPAGKP